MKKQLSNAAFIFLSCLITPAFSQTAPPQLSDNSSVTTSTDAKLTPNITGSNSSIGNIYSPNLFDGSANITIPFYQYATDYGDFGVSISYNTKGVKVDEVASPVGLHWDLNAGGGIFRVLKDAPDELNTNCQIPVDPGPTPPEASIKGKWALAFGATAAGEDLGQAGVYLDGEYDDFVVAAGGLSFTFNLGADGFIFTHPQRRVKIEVLIDGLPVTEIPFDNNNNSYALNIGFHITDEQGVQYFFEANTTEKWELWDGKYYNSETVREDDYISSWVIKKIILPNGQAIDYTYENTNSSGNLYKSYVSIEKLNMAPSTYGFDANASHSMQRISVIKYPNNIRVVFSYNESDPLSRCDANEANLEEISVNAGISSIRYVLTQGYSVAEHPSYISNPEASFSTPCNNLYQDVPSNVHIDYTKYTRMILKKISIKSKDGLHTEPYYSFEYDPLRLPKRMSGGQDYFGYYNGVVPTPDDEMTVPLHVPLIGTQTQLYGTTRTDNPLKTYAGLLKKVNNAYGGSVSFEYDAHVLENVLPDLPINDPLFMGWGADDGMRLKKVTQEDIFYPGNNSQTTFTYSGGQRFLAGGYFHYPKSVNDDGNIVDYYFTGIYVSPHQFVNGSNHGYSWVTSITKDQSGNLLDKKVINFTNFSDATSGNHPRYRMLGGQKHYYEWPFADRQYIKDWELGLPLEITRYDQNNHIVSKVINTYDTSTDASSTEGKIENKKVMRAIKYGLTGSHPWYQRYVPLDSVTYRPYTGWADLVKTETRKYTADNVYIQDTVIYQYDYPRHNLVSTIATNSKGEKTMLKQVYNYDVSGPDVFVGSQPGTTLYEMTAAGIEKVVSLERWKLPATPSYPSYNDRLIDASITRYDYNDGKIFTKGLYTLTAGSPLSYTDYTGISMGSPAINPYGKVLAAYNGTQSPDHFKELSKVTLFDAIGNPLETKLMGMDQYKAMLWDSATGNKIAEAVNAHHNEIGYTGFEAYDTEYPYVESGTVRSGNMVFNPNSIVVNSGIIRSAYKLNPATPLWCKLYFDVATGGKEYTVTFWCKDGVPVFSGNNGTNVNVSQLYSAGSWKFYQGHFTPVSGERMSFTATSSEIYVDEVHIFPSDAQMQTWVYEPLFGISAVSDARGRITYYEYDKLGRLRIVRNQEGKILSESLYKVYE